MKLSLCIIVKPTDDEAKLLGRCLRYTADYVDEICITQAGDKPNKKVSEVIKYYKGKESFFKWVNDFSKARNFNFAQATGDYILWLDSDDVLKGADFLEDSLKKMEKNKIDIGVMHYLYHFNKNGTCDTKHLKSRIIKNDGCVEWAGAIHEDFKENRTLDTCFIETVEVLHLTDDKRIDESVERNYEIAKQFLKDRPKDPRSYWLMGNALIMKQEPQEAEDNFKKYLTLSDSDEEKFLANMNLYGLTKDIKYLQDAWTLRPTYPDTYLKMGEYLYANKKYNEALNFTELGLQMPIPDKEIIAYNPREYDLFPLITMTKIYFELGKFDEAMKVVEKLEKLFPKEESVKELSRVVTEEMRDLTNVDKIIDDAPKDKKKLKKYLDNLPEKVASHPKICFFKNKNFFREKSSGKDLAYYCGYTSKPWNPNIAKKDGVGGSEEAVINLTKQLAKNWNITVYCNCGKEGEWDGVKYKFYWKYNVRDKWDATIFWRHPKPCDYELNCDKIYIDLHDVIADGEFTTKRLDKITKVFVKTRAHRDLFPSIPDDKIVIIPNGVDPSQFENKLEKNPYLILNTSSPDRHLDATLDVFEELIRRQPDKPWKLAWYYGWDVYDQVMAENKEMMDWKEKQMDRFVALVEQGRAEGGFMINHQEVADKYLEAGVFLYPTEFFEIHCISAVKAQLADCKMVTSDFAALNETVSDVHPKIHTEGKKWETERTFGDTKNRDKYVRAILKEGQYPSSSDWAKKKYNWDNVASQWSMEI